MTQTETTIRNCAEDFARVVEEVDRLAADCHLAPEVVADVQVALDEVLTNIVEYAYTDDAEHAIRIRLSVLDDLIEAMIEDDGVPFNPLASAAPDTSAQLRERRVGGLGLHFVKNLMDEVSYDRVDDRNRLVIRKKLTA